MASTCAADYAQLDRAVASTFVGWPGQLAADVRYRPKQIRGCRLSAAIAAFSLEKRRFIDANSDAVWCAIVSLRINAFSSFWSSWRGGHKPGKPGILRDFIHTYIHNFYFRQRGPYTHIKHHTQKPKTIDKKVKKYKMKLICTKCLKHTNQSINLQFTLIKCAKKQYYHCHTYAKAV